jgi:hypothetical protein
MKLRPQMQLRFRDEAQFEQMSAMAAARGLSMNEWVLRQVEESEDLKRGLASVAGLLRIPVRGVSSGYKASETGSVSAVETGVEEGGKGDEPSVVQPGGEGRSEGGDVVGNEIVREHDSGPVEASTEVKAVTIPARIPGVTTASKLPMPSRPKVSACPECRSLNGMHQKGCSKR